MRNVIKTAVGVSALILSGVAVADHEVGHPADVPILNVNFGELALSAGTPADKLACETAVGAGAKCSDIATGSGFTQRQIDVGGKSFIQTLIVDGTFNSEDFVQIAFGSAAGGVDGIASQLSLSENSATTGDFSAASTIKSGWGNALDATKTSAVLNVQLEKGAVGSAQYFNSDFDIDTTFDGTNNVVNSLKADQTVNLNSVTDKQRFVTKIEAAETDQTAYAFTGGTGSTTYATATNDQIQVVWIGQEVSGVGSFGSQSLSKVGTASKTAVTSLADPDPVQWSDNGAAADDVLFTEFGAAPTF